MPCASAAQSRPTALPCNAALGFRQKQACRVFADRAVLRDSRNVFLRRSGQLPHLVQRRSDRPTGKEKRRDSLSLTKRWPEAEGDEQCGKCPPPRAAAAQHRRFPRASGTSSIGSRPQNARNVRREFHKPLPEARARTARQNLHTAPSLGHNGSRAAHRQKIFLRLNSKTRRPPKRETGTSPRRKYLTCPAS